MIAHEIVKQGSILFSDEANSRNPQAGKWLQVWLQMQSGKVFVKEPFLLKQEGTFLDLLRVYTLFCPFRMPELWSAIFFKWP